MAINSPQTYADWYWKMATEATAFSDEAIEEAFAPYFSGVLSDIGFLSELPTGLRNLVSSLAEPPSAGFGGFALGVGVEMVDETLHNLMSPMMKIMARNINKKALETWLTSAEANKLFSQGKIEKGFWDETLKSEGYEEIVGKFLYESQLPYPSIPEIMLYARYHTDPDDIQNFVWDWLDVPIRDFKLWEWLSLQKLNAEQIHTLFRRNKLSENEALKGFAQMGWDEDDRALQLELGWQIPNAMLLVQGGLIQNVQDDKLLTDIQLADIHPDFARTYLDAVLTKPSTEDVINYQLRKEPLLSGLSPELRKIGIHPDYFDLYKELAQIIPPIGDIITMAVREAFTPEIASKFGQYENFPQPLEEWAAKKGLSKEWAERYWAAHWSLPSPQQGFEMLHRGVITQDELNMLLRALDVMPFWRDKLTSIAYNVLTRVDIRRMYQTGVLNEGDVEQAYLESGYNEKDAKRLTEFTIKITQQTLSKFNSGDVIEAYATRKIDRGEAANLLSNLGIRSADIPNILESADYKKKWEFADTQTKAIRNLYKRRVYDKTQAQNALQQLNIPSDQIEALLNQWFYELKEQEPALWTTAQTLTFVKQGIISKQRAKDELELLGYDAEHITVYLESSAVVSK